MVFIYLSQRGRCTTNIIRVPLQPVMMSQLSGCQVQIQGWHCDQDREVSSQDKGVH